MIILQSPMIRLTSLLAALVVLLFSATEGVSADIKKGGAAYQRGDCRTALREWKPLAEEGDPAAQSGMGLLYENGCGVPQNYRAALIWHRLAATAGLAGAQYNLALMCLEEGTPCDDTEAAKWLRLASEQGLHPAQANLAVLYAYGDGVPQDYIISYMWAGLAASMGHVLAERLVEEHLTKRMSLEDILIATSLAKICLRTSYKQCGYPE